MDKISVEVFVPALGKSYEFILPSVMKVETAAKLIAQAVSEQEEGVKICREGLVLCSKEKECVLIDQMTIENAGVPDGSRLILV